MIPDHLAGFWAPPRLATFGSVRRDGSVHQVPVKCMRVGEDFVVLTRPGTVKVRNARRTGRGSLAEHTDSLWVTVEGPIVVADDEARRAAARAAYQQRYGRPESGWATCLLVLTPERVLHGD
jgi:hypothetical protein